MGPGETIGLIAVVVLMIVVIGVASDAYRRRRNFKQRELELRAAGSTASSRDAVDVALIGKLEQRLRVLERIATDRDQIASATLAAEIEDLRHATRKEGELQ